MTDIVRSARMRETPYTPRVDAAGVKAYSTYNHMLLAANFGDIEAECRHLKTAVQVWDVACERQVELRGPDAFRLAQMTTPRDLSRIAADQCAYAPTVDRNGRMLNDPVMLKLAEDRWWISIADSDVALYAEGLAAGAGLDVEVFEPDVNIIAVQGPRADELAARVFGDEVKAIRFFRHATLDFEGTPMLVARSGYSKQGGVEIYVPGWENGLPLWDALMDAGRDLDVRVGCPNLIERVEGGLLSYGADMTREHTAYEAGLGRYCSPDAPCVGREALAREAAEGPKRMIRSLSVEGGRLPTAARPWPLYADGERVGRISIAVWSPDFETNVALGMVERSHWTDGTRLEAETPEGLRPAVVRERPFI